MKQLDKEEIKILLETSTNIVLTTHRSPDGDAIGSSLAMCHLLNNTHNVTVTTPDISPDFLRFLPGSDVILTYEENEEEIRSAVEQADLIFCLDYNGLGRIGAMSDLIGNAKAKKVMIDHHQFPDNFVDFQYWNDECGSTCELVFDLMAFIVGTEKFTLDFGTCVYTGIMTDSGSFKYPSTSSHTHLIASILLELGVSHFDIHSAVYDTATVGRLRLLGFALSEKMTLLENKTVALIDLNNEELHKFGYQKGYTEGIVNYGLSLDGVRVAILLSQPEDAVKMSFRSKGDYPINLLAKKLFGGGGHKNAAGAKSEKSMEDVKKLIKAELAEFIKENTKN